MLKVGDKVKFGQMRGKVIGILLRGKGYREYECIFSDKDGEPSKYWLSEYDIKSIENENKKFGFANEGNIRKDNAGKRTSACN